MKTLSCIFAILVSGNLAAQNKRTTFYDSAGKVTTWEGHWAQVVTGRFKSEYDRRENKKTLVRTTTEEFKEEMRKTEKRIKVDDHIGTTFPEFDLVDINGKRLNTNDLKGKVLVLNFWFIGCSPCEMERPSLNKLTEIYSNNGDVVFISFAKNDKTDLTPFLADHPVNYHVIATGKDLIRAQFKIDQYPANIIVDRNGKYAYNSIASGVGILSILKREIERALAQ